MGGYLELELPVAGAHFHAAAVRLYSGRACLACAVLHDPTVKLFLPYFMCDVLLEPLRAHGIAYEYYSINDRFEIVDPPSLGAGEKLLYINYFGLKDAYTGVLAKKYGGSLIIDNTHAFFSPPLPGVSTFYSPRKFFGVPDGGYLYPAGGMPEVGQYPVYAPAYDHLIGRIVDGAQAHYDDFQANEHALEYKGIRRMSPFSERVLASIDYARARAARERNFAILQRELGRHNRLELTGVEHPGPFAYPLRTADLELRDKLIARSILVPRFWVEVLGRVTRADQVERALVEEIAPLPVDQRYDDSDMQRIVGVVKELL